MTFIVFQKVYRVNGRVKVVDIILSNYCFIINYNFCNSSSRYINSSQAFADPEHTNHEIICTSLQYEYLYKWICIGMTDEENEFG